MRRDLHTEQGGIAADDERLVTFLLTLDDAEDLRELLGSRPQNEEWSRRLWDGLRAAIDATRARIPPHRQGRRL